MSRLNPTLAERCRIHAHKMDDEGWYVTANVLSEAAKAIEENEKLIEAMRISRDVARQSRLYLDKITK